MANYILFFFFIFCILGIVGGWKSVLTVEMSNQVDEMFQREFGDTDLTFE